MLASDSYDRRLEWYERWALRGHFLVCTVCRKLKKQLKILHETREHLCCEHELASKKLSPEASSRIRKAIEQES
ncbi:MAG: zf-HC2 domain-containing protein [Planctomycetota bacterium]